MTAPLKLMLSPSPVVKLSLITYLGQKGCIWRDAKNVQCYGNVAGGARVVDCRFDCVVFIFASIVNKTCVMLNKILYYNSFMFFSTLFSLQERAQWTEWTLINYNLKGWQENLQMFLKIKCYCFAHFSVN